MIFFETDYKYIHNTSLFIVLDFRNITDISLQFPVPDDLDFYNDGFYQPWLIIVHGEYELTDTLPLFKVEDYFHDRREGQDISQNPIQDRSHARGTSQMPALITTYKRKC